MSSSPNEQKLKQKIQEQEVELQQLKQKAKVPTWTGREQLEINKANAKNQQTMFDKHVNDVDNRIQQIEDRREKRVKEAKEIVSDEKGKFTLPTAAATGLAGYVAYNFADPQTALYTALGGVVLTLLLRTRPETNAAKEARADIRAANSAADQQIAAFEASTRAPNFK